MRRPWLAPILFIVSLSSHAQASAAVAQQDPTHADPATSAADPASTVAADAGDRPAMLEATLDRAQGYVGQQFDYTLRLYLTLGLSDGSLPHPVADGADMVMVGQEARYDVTRNGHVVHVTERHYAVVPQQAGVIEIHPPLFQGLGIDPTDVNSFYAQGQLVYADGQPLSATAQTLRLEVRDRPAAVGNDTWLPAHGLKLWLEGVPADGKATVGRALTLTMHLEATGLSFDALPALSMPKIDGADVYPDKPVKGDRLSGPWIVGRREQAFAVVPSRPGTLHIPETTLHWWNVVTDKAEVATLPARDIVVAPGSGATTQTASTTPTSAAAPASMPSAGVDAGPWRAIAAGLGVLWILTLLAWFGWARRRRGQAAVAPSTPGGTPRSAPAREQFLRVAAGDDLVASGRALLDWARAQRPGVRSLGELALALRPGRQRDAIAALQRARFANGASAKPDLRGVFADGFEWLATDAEGAGPGLPPLYPR
ncbi:BatD family protein [Bacillus sp. NP157]|nr:BatD family protein [Bacillus sp. NP157]